MTGLKESILSLRFESISVGPPHRASCRSRPRGFIAGSYAAQHTHCNNNKATICGSYNFHEASARGQATCVKRYSLGNRRLLTTSRRSYGARAPENDGGSRQMFQKVSCSVSFCTVIVKLHARKCNWMLKNRAGCFCPVTVYNETRFYNHRHTSSSRRSVLTTAEVAQERAGICSASNLAYSRNCVTSCAELHCSTSR
jgi:hypothetical protein